MEFRRIFDTIPEQFDKYRPRYSHELFMYLIKFARIDSRSKVLELGPGTGQATEPILDTGCEYDAIELGEHLYAKMKQKYDRRPNFHIVNDDFITHDFRDKRYDCIYSAATIQWIPEETAFQKTYSLLNSGGTLAMLTTRGDYRTPNEELFLRIQEVYSEYFKPVIEYPHRGFRYDHALNYGYTSFERQEFVKRRVLTADEYVAYCGTHCDHIVIPEPYKSKFYAGLRGAVESAGGKIEFRDVYTLYLAAKP